VYVKIGYSRLGNRREILLLGFVPEITGNQRINYVALDFFGKALADNGSWDFALAEARNSRQFLIAVNEIFSLRFYYLGRNFNGEFALTRINFFGGRFCLCSFSRQGIAFKQIKNGRTRREPSLEVECTMCSGCEGAGDASRKTNALAPNISL
jgi:hypothetical protein